MEGLRRVFAEVTQSFGSIDGLINAAGIGTGGPFVECDQATIERIIAINVSKYCPARNDRLS